jgi:Cu/Ag efflux protein CusF
MRKVLMTAMTVMLVAGVAMAEGAKGKGGKNSQMTGEVTAVDAAAGKLSIKDAKGVVTEVMVPADAKVFKPGKKGATLADVMVGDMVTIGSAELNGVKTVKSVKVRPPKKAKAEKPKAEKGKGGK